MTGAPASLQADLADRYLIERELGRGGMATVYLGRDLKHRRPVALKVLNPAVAASLGADRFLREIELAARLQHPHILTVFDSGNANGVLWFTMPYVEGETLRARLLRERQLPLGDALRIATEAARALEFAHQHGVLHRDVKPENLLLTTDGSTLVADFGIARASDESGQLTQTGIVLGTPAYMSPEQATGERALDARTDVYSLGCVLYEMLAGELPHTGPNPQAILAKRLSEPVPRLHTTREVPQAVESTVTRALARAPCGPLCVGRRVLARAPERRGADSPGCGAACGARRPRSLARGRSVLVVVTGAALVLRTRRHAVVAATDFLWGRGRLDEALQQMQQAQQLDPLSLVIGSELGQTYYLQRRFGEAEAHLRETLALDPNYPHSLYIIGLVYLQQHRYQEAIGAMRRALELGGFQEDLAGGLAYAYGAYGDRAAATSYTSELQARLKRGGVGPFALALAYTGQGDLTRGFEYLNRAIDEQDIFLPEDFFDPLLDPLRADRRFAMVEERMGIKRNIKR